MGGHFRYDEKAKRYYISVYWDSKRYKIWRYKDEPILHPKTADKLLNKIRAEVDDGTFDPRHYMPESPLGLKAYSEVWLSGSPSCANTKRVHRSAIKKAIEAWGPNCDIRTITFSKLSILHNTMTGSAKYRNSVLIALKAMFNFALKDGVIRTIPPLRIL